MQFVVGGKKYEDFIFYLFPYYHLLLPSIDQLIVLDFDTCKNIAVLFSLTNFIALVFKVDPFMLHEEFSKFNDSHLLGMGVDLNLQYNHKLSRYRKENPGTLVGMPGRYQGLNTGVILMDLDRIRQSSIYRFGTVKDKKPFVAAHYPLTQILPQSEWHHRAIGQLQILQCKINFYDNYLFFNYIHGRIFSAAAHG